jgi:hypothetical protein
MPLGRLLGSMVAAVPSRPDPPGGSSPENTLETPMAMPVPRWAPVKFTTSCEAKPGQSALGGGTPHPHASPTHAIPRQSE